MANVVETEFRLKGIEDSLKKINDYQKALNNLSKGGQVGGGANFNAFEKQLESALRKSVSLASQFQKFSTLKGFEGMNKSAQAFEKRTLDLYKILRNIDVAMRQNPRQSVMTLLEGQAKHAINELKSLEKKLLDIKAQNIGVGNKNSSGLGQFSSVLGSLPGGSILSGAVAGGVGGAVAATLTEAINLTKQLGAALVTLGKDAVQASSDFDRTVRGLAVFAGGAANARQELQAIDEVAQQTQGLALVDAEAGYKRLRALGFAAETSTAIVRGLAVQTQLVGATSLDVDRVIVNLIQLSSATTRASQDIREMIHSIPSLKAVFQDAFGTISGEELGKIFSADPKNATARFAASLAKVEQAAPGLSGALTRLQNQYVLTQRAFGEPLLDPLIQAVEFLTNILEENKETFKEWGQSVGDTIRGVIDALEKYKQSRKLQEQFFEVNDEDVLGFGQRVGVGWFTGGLSEIGFGIQNQFKVEGKYQRLKKELDLIRKPKAKLIGGVGTYSFGELGEKIQAQEDKRKKEEEETLYKEAVRLQKIEDDARALETKRIESRRAEQVKFNEGQLKLQELQLTTHLATTRQQEIENIKTVSNLKSNYYRQEYVRTLAHYRDLANQLNQTDEKYNEEKLQLETEKNKELLDLQQKFGENALNTQREIALKEKEIFEERKKAQKQITESAASLFELKTGNPFVKIFNDGKTAIENFKESFKDATPEMVRQFEKITEATTRTRAALEQLARTQAARGFRNQARELRTLLPSEIGGIPRLLSSLEQSLGYLASGQSFRRDALANRRFAGAFGEQDVTRIQEDLTKDILAPFREFQKGVQSLFRTPGTFLGTYFSNLYPSDRFKNLGIYGQEKIAQASLAQLPSQQELIGLISSGAINADQARQALNLRAGFEDTLAQASQKHLQDSLEKTDLLNQRVKEQAKEVDEAKRLLGTKNEIPLADKLDNLISTFAAKGVENLTPQELKENIAALEQRANIEEKRYEEAKAWRDGIKNDISAIKTSLSGDLATVRIVNEAKQNATVTVRGRADNARDYYAQN